MKKAKIDIPELEKIVRQIVEKFHPQKIILFGSRAYGKADKDSDFDLMIIMETKERVVQTAAKISASIDHPFPLDILVYTPSEVKKRLEWGDGLLYDAIKKGIVLYEESADQRVGEQS